MSQGLKLGRNSSVFFSGFIAGLVALAFNFLIRLAGLAVFPPEAALGAFLGIVPASIEEPMVQALGDFAGQLGLIVATVLAAVVYGLFAVLFDRFLARRLLSRSISVVESAIVLSLFPWLIFGLVLFPAVGVSIFGSSSPIIPESDIWLLPFSLLLVQGVFALLFASRYARVAPSVVAGTTASRSLRSKGRRDFIEKGSIAVLALIAGFISLTNLPSFASSQIQPSGGSTAIDLQDAPPIFRDPRLQNLVDSEVTPNGSFYRVAIDIIDPSVDASGWSLKVDGLVNAPKSYSLQDLQNLSQASQYSTFECVSNDIDGPLISTAKWTGLRMSDLFQDAGGVQAGANYVVFYSVDGYSVGIPLSKAMMSDSILAYTMNDQPLPVGHGYPLRAVIPGLYGMMSAKWIKEISIVGATYEGYWQTRGWTNGGTINTGTFIVVPSDMGQVSLQQNNGSMIVAGFAFGGDRGISKVEVSFDRGQTWQETQLKQPLSGLTWVLWAYEWQNPSPGQHFIYARATDGAGQTQTSTVAGTFPNGATGYTYTEVYVTD